VSTLRRHGILETTGPCAPAPSCIVGPEVVSTVLPNAHARHERSDRGSALTVG
jgi:hypothetical protein